MKICNLVITKKCGTRLANSMFLGHGPDCLEKKALELSKEVPFENVTIEGFLYIPAEGFVKVLQASF